MAETLEAISERVVKCTLCDLSNGRKNAVPGEGMANAKLMIIGEAPGKYEDILGKPFVGMSGKFLNKYLELAGIDRSSTFITNSVKCRPPNNRKPVIEEISACRSYLISQISLIKPKLLLCLGTSACNSMEIRYQHLSEVRGRPMHLKFYGLEIECFVTFHPSFPMRFPKARETFLADLKEAKKIVGM
ncbi:uracil-DNA glycosylase [Candidatus Parvarchaeota archaeon]|nr:uracil-DNA glycosylase [Candidatus Parvarchaeota archaeon]